MEDDMICHKRRALTIPAVVVVWATLVHAQSSISAVDAKNHVGEKATFTEK